MIYVLTISKINPPSEEFLKEMEDRHTAPNLEVVRKYLDEEMPNGFAIEKRDKLLGDIAKNDPDLQKSMDLKHVEIIAREKAFLKKQQRLAGADPDAEPYEPKT